VAPLKDRNFGEKPGQILEDFFWGGNSVATTAAAGFLGGERRDD